MLADGLDQLEQRRQAWRLHGCAILGAFTLGDAQGQSDDALPRARWVMRRVSPLPEVKTADYMTSDPGPGYPLQKATCAPQLPSPKMRHRIYQQALEAAVGGSLQKHRILMNYDDHPGNMLLERLPMRSRRLIKRMHPDEQGLATKIDVFGIEGFSF